MQIRRQVCMQKLVQSSLLAFPDGLLPVSFGVPLALPSSLPFPSPFEFRCGEPVGKVNEVITFLCLFLFGSCLNAHASPNEHWPWVIQRMQSPLSELCLAFAFPFIELLISL